MSDSSASTVDFTNLGLSDLMLLLLRSGVYGADPRPGGFDSGPRGLGSVGSGPHRDRKDGGVYHPCAERVERSKQGYPQALILVPTRVAVQVRGEITKLAFGRKTCDGRLWWQADPW